MRLGLGFEPEQRELQNVVRAYLAKYSDEARVRAVMTSESGVDLDLWRGLAGELGCQGLTVAESAGGSDATLVEQGLVFQELGRSLACVPYFATVGLALNLLLQIDDEGAADAASRIAAGDLIATVALCESGGDWHPLSIAMTAERDGDAWSLTGEKTYVPDGHLADLLLVVAAVPDGLGIFAVESGRTGVELVQLPTMDQTRRQARVLLTAAPARRLGSGDAREVLMRAMSQAAALLAMEQVGVASRILDGTIEHVTTRSQFGKPIGSFQTVKHRIADMLLDLEAARSAAYHALFAAAAGDDELNVAASVAKAFCSDAAGRIARAAIQLHGGIGLTWEHWVHLYFKRAASSAVLLGSAAAHRESVAAHIGI